MSAIFHSGPQEEVRANVDRSKPPLVRQKTTDAIGRAGTASSQVKRARMLIVVFFALVGLALLSPVSRPLLYLFPFAAAVLAYRISKLSSRVYINFSILIWTLTPFVRRLVDYRSGWINAAFVLTTPLIVSLIPMISAVRWPSRAINARSAPVLVVIATCVYACVLGLRNFGFSYVLQDLISWLAPLAIVFYVHAHRDDLPEIIRGFEEAMLICLLVLGIYGVIQFFFMPPWDIMWMVHTRINSIGPPERMKVRVFSTMNSPQVLASYLASGVLIGLTSSNRLKFVAIPLALLTLLLSLARSGWLALLVGLLFLLLFLTNRQRLMLLVVTALCGSALLASLENAYIQETAAKRLQTFTSIGSDVSYLDRSEGYVAFFGSLADHPYGLGMGAVMEGRTDPVTVLGHNGKTVLMGDSMIATAFTSLGVPGALLCTFALMALLIQVYSGKTFRDRGSRTLQAVLAGLLIESVLMPVLVGPTGYLTWLCIALLLTKRTVASEIADAQPARNMRRVLTSSVRKEAL